MGVKFISEVSSNHHRSLERALDFIRVSKEIGCDAVKFQLFKIDELFAPEILRKRPELQKRREWELPVEMLPDLAAACREMKIEFSCTPFYLKAVDELAPHVDFFKVASYELPWTDLLRACGQSGKPVILSTGMATMDEVQRAYETLVLAGAKDVTLLHCNSGYPTPLEDANLKVIETLRASTGAKVGWSDHTVRPSVIYRAVHRFAAETVEFHLDLDGQGDEFKTGHCWLPDRIRSVISDVREGFVADGQGAKRPSPSELPDRPWRADPSDGLRPTLEVRKSYQT